MLANIQRRRELQHAAALVERSHARGNEGLGRGDGSGRWGGVAHGDVCKP